MTDKKEDTQASERTIEEVFESLHANLLKEFLEGNGAKAGKSSTKKKAVSAIMEIAEEKGKGLFLGKLDKDAMKAALLVVEGTDDLGHDSKTKMAKSVKDHISKLGVDKFFEKLDTNVLDLFCKAMEFEEEGGKDEKIDALCEEILISGLRKMFETMAKEFITDVAKQLKLATSGSRPKLVDRILAEGYPHLKEADKSDDKKKSKKAKGDFSDAPDVKDIKRGISFQDLYQYYTQQLQDWLKENGYKSSGTKKDLAKRIEGVLKGDEKAIKDATKLKPGERRKRKRGGVGRAPTKKKSDEEEEGEEDEETEEKPAKKQKTA